MGQSRRKSTPTESFFVKEKLFVKLGVRKNLTNKSRKALQMKGPGFIWGVIKIFS